MLIRTIEPGDFGNLSALAIYVWLATYATSGIRDKISHFALKNFTPDTFKKQQEDPNKRVYVAIEDDHLVGYITVNFKSKHNNSDKYGYEIETLYVHPCFQKQGIGRALIAHCQNSCGKIFWLSTWFKNIVAIEFYQHLGIKKVGTTEFNLSGEMHLNYVLSNAKSP